MEITLHIGERGTVDDFVYAYKPGFLINYGFAVLKDFGSSKITYLVYTKEGPEKVEAFDTVTYVGKKHWSIERWKYKEDGNDMDTHNAKMARF